MPDMADQLFRAGLEVNPVLARIVPLCLAIKGKIASLGAVRP